MYDYQTSGAYFSALHEEREAQISMQLEADGAADAALGLTPLSRDEDYLRGFNLITCNYSPTFPTLYATDKNTSTAVRTFRWYVQLASHELDDEGEIASWIIADVITTSPGEKAIRKVLHEAGLLANWTLVDAWEPDDAYAPF